MKYLKLDGVPIIAGFQGINSENRITTIGRGGSDASAIMIAKFFKAKKCIIYTDVDGIYTTDPRIVPKSLAPPHRFTKLKHKSPNTAKKP